MRTARTALIALSAAAALTVGTLSAPTSANAYPVWVIPAIIAAGVGGLAVGGSAAAANDQAYYPGRGTVTVVPGSDCHMATARTRSGRLRSVEVCD